VKDNKEAFEKLGSSDGGNAQFPKFSKPLEDFGLAEVGEWMHKDPSTWGFQSWLVAKWDSWSPQLQQELKIWEKFEKFTMFVLAPILVAMVAKLAIFDPEGLAKLAMIVDIFGKFAIVVLLLKLAKFGQVLQFTTWKLLGLLTKLEFAIICAGGNANKLWSMSATKLSFLEFRTQEARGSQIDIGRDLTNYLQNSCDQSLEYLKVGVERRAKSWVETRKQLKDLDRMEWEATWTKLKQEAFDHAFANLEELKKTAEVMKIAKDVQYLNEGIAKLEELLKSGDEASRLETLW